MIKNIFLTIFLIIAITACTTHSGIVPVGENNLKGNISFGGPIIEAFGTNIPLPYLTAGIEYGYSDKININGNLHILPLAYSIAGLDMGLSWFPILNDGIIPTIGLQPKLVGFMSLKENVKERFRLFPALSGTFAWSLGEDYLYSGCDISTQLTKMDYYSEAETMILSPFIGYKYDIGKKMFLSAEIKWQGANVRTDQLAVTYTKIMDYGALGILFSIERSF